MSIAFNADKEALRRTTNLWASHANFTVMCCVKIVSPRPANQAHIIYTQSIGDAYAETVFVQGGLGLTLIGGDNYNVTLSPDVATLPSGGSSGANWGVVGLIGTAAGAGGLKVLYSAIGSGTVTTQTLLNSPGTTGASALQIGDLPYGTTGWLDGLVAHLKVYNRALSDSEFLAEAASAAPVSTSSLLSYHSFTNSDIAVAVVPDQGSGTFSYFTSAPSTSTDNPVFASTPTLTLSGALPATATSIETVPGAPTLTAATVATARTVNVTWTAASGTVTGYRVYAQRPGGAAFVIATTGSGTLTATGVGLSPNTSYTIYVVAYNGVGEGLPSNTLSRTTRKFKVRMSKVEKTISGVTGLRMIAWLEGSSNRLGDKIGESTQVVVGTPTLDAIEGDQVCTVTGDFSTESTFDLDAGDTVLAVVEKAADNLSTGVRSATIVEEA